MNQENLRETVLQYLAGCNALTLATRGSQGPWAASVFYFNQQLDLYFLSSPNSRHGQNLTDDPQVAATINLDYGSWLDIKGIQLEGRAEHLGGIAGNLKLARAYVKKFPEVKDFLLSPHKLGQAIASKVTRVHFYRIVPQRLYYLNNAEGFGHRLELPL